MRSIPAAILLATIVATAADAQSVIAPGDLDHVLGAALALSVDAADQLAEVHEMPIESPSGLRDAQRRAFRAAMTANRAQSYLRLYVMHLGEHPEAVGEPQPAWTDLAAALEHVPAIVEALLDAPAESLTAFDVTHSRNDFDALAGRLRSAAETIGELPDSYGN